MWKDCIKCRTKVYKKRPHIVPPPFQMSQSSIKSDGYSVLCGSISSICKLRFIKCIRKTRNGMPTDQFFKALHDDRSECPWSVVAEVINGELLWQQNNDGSLQTRQNSGLREGPIKDLSKLWLTSSSCFIVLCLLIKQDLGASSAAYLIYICVKVCMVHIELPS